MKNLIVKLLSNFFISIIYTTFWFIIITDFGTFNPLKMGFWFCLFAGVLANLLFRFFMKWGRKKYEEQNVKTG